MAVLVKLLDSAWNSPVSLIDLIAWLLKDSYCSGGILSSPGLHINRKIPDLNTTTHFKVEFHIRVKKYFSAS